MIGCSLAQTNRIAKPTRLVRSWCQALSAGHRRVPLPRLKIRWRKMMLELTLMYRLIEASRASLLSRVSFNSCLWSSRLDLGEAERQDLPCDLQG